MNVTDTAPTATASPLVNILIVEDEYILAANLQENLKALGYGVLDIVASAEESIPTATEMRPDVVLMDVRLQGEMDGIQAAEQIWTRLQIPVIYVTGHSDRVTVEQAKLTAPFGYLLKPVREKELYVAIETALNRYQREQFFSNVLQQIGDGIVVVDYHCRIKYLNRVAELLTGWQQEDAKHQDVMTVLNLVGEDMRQPIANPAQMAFQQEGAIYLNQRVLLIKKDGFTLPVTVSVASLIDNKGNLTGAILVFRDDTQRQLQENHNLSRQRAELMERQVEELHRLNQLKDDFLSTISHELRTPLAAIKMAIQMLEISLDQRIPSPAPSETDFQSQPPEQYLSILREQCDHELNLVNDLLELQHLGNEGVPMTLTSIEILEWVPNVAETFQAYANQRQQCLQVLLPPTLPNLVSDVAVFTRILRELLTNACKYTPPHGVITVSAQHIEERLQIVVTNSGVEIPQEELLRIFDKFYRIPTSDRWKQGGTGLGLALIKKLVAYLGGSIWAESEPEQTRFIFEILISPPTP